MELGDTAVSDLSRNSISFRTRILTQEVLAKMAYILDQTMWSFYEKKIRYSLAATERKHADRQVYFPIVLKQTELIPKLGCAGMKDLNIKYPKVFSYLDSIQPYYKGYEWLAVFKKFANERHIRLSRQERVEQKYLVLEHGGERHKLWSAAQVGSAGLSVGGKRIHPNQLLSYDSEHIMTDPEIKIEKKKSVTLVFAGTKIDAIGLCHTSVIEGRTMISQFLSLC